MSSILIVGFNSKDANQKVDMDKQKYIEHLLNNVRLTLEEISVLVNYKFPDAENAPYSDNKYHLELVSYMMSLLEQDDKRKRPEQYPKYIVVRRTETNKGTTMIFDGMEEGVARYYRPAGHWWQSVELVEGELLEYSDFYGESKHPCYAVTEEEFINTNKPYV